jgi:hypothetical protein
MALLNLRNFYDVKCPRLLVIQNCRSYFYYYDTLLSLSLPSPKVVEGANPKTILIHYTYKTLAQFWRY